MSENAGLYQKFEVARKDGRDQPGGDREGAVYFVLDIVNDPCALAAIAAYKIACLRDVPLLADALDDLEREIIHGRKSGPMHDALRTPK